MNLSGPVKQSAYLNIGSDPEAGWFVGPLSSGRAALCPTRTADSFPANTWLILPEVTVSHHDEVVRWDARSLYRHFPESYSVLVCPSGSEQWTKVFQCPSESHAFTTHAVSLADFTGETIRIAFVAETIDGFMLAIDNILVGVPEDDAVTFHSSSPHFAGADDDVRICGTIEYFGHKSPWKSAILRTPESSMAIELPTLACGECFTVDFPIAMEAGQSFDYQILLDDGIEPTPLYTDFITCSYYRRTHLVDHCTGTWCNNCPIMDLSTSRLARLYGDELVFIESHVNDVLTDTGYWDAYLSNYVFAIPLLLPNHQPKKLVYSLKDKDNFSASLETATIAGISASAAFAHNGDIAVSANASFAIPSDNTDDRYRFAYMLVADVHDPLNPSYIQHNSAAIPDFDEFYYLSTRISPDMMYFENVVISGELSSDGVPASLPAYISPSSIYSHSFTLPFTNHIDYENIRVIALLVDTTTRAVLNAAVCPVSDASAIVATPSDNPAREYFDLLGRRITGRRSGVFIEKGVGVFFNR